MMWLRQSLWVVAAERLANTGEDQQGKAVGCDAQPDRCLLGNRLTKVVNRWQCNCLGLAARSVGRIPVGWWHDFVCLVFFGFHLGVLSC